MNARTYLLTDSEGAGVAELEARLKRDGHHVIAGLRDGDVEKIDGVVLQTKNEPLGITFLDLTDSDIGAALDRFVDMIALLQRALHRVREGGSVVIVTSRGYLGAWGGAHEMAFSAATVALIRSVALECMPRRVRANVIAVDRSAAANSPAVSSDHARSVADIAAFLLGDESRLISGEVMLANAGRSLQMREARQHHRQ